MQDERKEWRQEREIEHVLSSITRKKKRDCVYKEGMPAKNEFLSEGFITEPRVRWSEHVPCFIWDDEAIGPGKLSLSTIPREYHHSSIEEEG